MRISYPGLARLTHEEGSGGDDIHKSIPEIVVTDSMINAGLAELREHSYTGDLRYVL